MYKLNLKGFSYKILFNKEKKIKGEKENSKIQKINFGI